MKADPHLLHVETKGSSNPSLSGSPGSWAFALGLFGEAKLRSASTYGCIREETWIDMAGVSS